MWVPRDAKEIEHAARAGELSETPSFDAKAALPEPRKNADLATDVAAMATDGGVLLYGVAEDGHKRPTVPRPIALAGAGDRIGNIVSTSVAEVPYIDVKEYPTQEDPSKGYIAVLVPQSPRAPHQVTVGGDLRFYGRGAKGNRRLTEGEVARLYQRRGAWEQDREALLAKAVADSGIDPVVAPGHLHALTRPVAPDDGLFERAASKLGGPQKLHQTLLRVASSTRLAGKYSPGLHNANYWDRRAADEWRLATRSEAERATDPTGLAEVRSALTDADNCSAAGRPTHGSAANIK